MKRVAVILLGVVVLALMPTIGCAQGLFGGLPGLPSFGGLTGGSSGCGEKLCPSSNLQFYIGWMEDRDGTSINVDAEGVGATLVAGTNVNSVRHHYSNRGLWLGLSDTICISDRLSFIASGWYLVPSSTSSREEYFLNGVNIRGLDTTDRTWHTKPQWWYVDGIFAIGSPCGGFALLAGLRYDYYTARFENPYNFGNAVFGLTDEADVTSEGWIPLLGTQYALSSSMGSLVVRAVGVPTLVGTARYKQTIGGIGERVEAKGNWNGRGFLEVFTEYSKSFGPGAVGVFGRWNIAQGNADLDLNIAPLPGSQTYKLALHRNSWTFGASFSLNFNMPFM